MAYPPPTATYCGPVAHDSGTGNLPVTRIVIHCTVGSDAKGATGTCAYFRSSSAGGSAHYITDANLTLRCASLDLICWHAPPNGHSIGIELCCSLSNKGEGHWVQANHQAMLKRSATLTAELCLHLGVPARKLSVSQVAANAKGICGHADVSAAFKQSTHWDPGPYFPWTQFMNMVTAEVKRLSGAAPTPPTPPEDDLPYTEAQLRAMMQAEIEEYAARLWGEGGSAGEFMQRTDARLTELLKRVPPVQDTPPPAAPIP